MQKAEQFVQLSRRAARRLQPPQATQYQANLRLHNIAGWIQAYTNAQLEAEQDRTAQPSLLAPPPSEASSASTRSARPTMAALQEALKATSVSEISLTDALMLGRVQVECLKEKHKKTPSIDAGPSNDSPATDVQQEHGPVGRALDVTNAEKYKVYFRSGKQMQPCNRLPNEESDKLPLFTRQNIKPAVVKDTYWTIFPCNREKLRRHMQTDVDLVYALKLEAAFCARTPGLLAQLKQKAKKWVAQWDMSLYTSKEIYEIITRAVGHAMLIDKEEEKVRALCHMRSERGNVRPVHNRFLSLGQTGVSASTALNRHPKKGFAVTTYLKNRLTRVIKF